MTKTLFQMKFNCGVVRMKVPCEGTTILLSLPIVMKE
jgi:hypothetical protein